MNFDAIVSSLQLSNAPTVEKRLCPDQYVGKIGANQAKKKFTVRLPVIDRPDEPAIILVLESPHIAEFQDQIGPAKGRTGTNIWRFITQVPGLEETDELPLILVNAVQYQCSLGRVPDQFRDKVFSAVWVRGGKEDFVHRMKHTYRAGDILVCSCTKGKAYGRAELRQLVYAAIREEFPNACLLRRTHPSMWTIGKNRSHEWPLITELADR